MALYKHNEKKAFVKEKFSTVTRRYDLLNTLLSLNEDKKWRSITVKAISTAPHGPVLDLCAGTLPLSIEIERRLKRGVAALDFCLEMLKFGRFRLNNTKNRLNISLIQGDAELIPFKDHTFSAVTIAFGLRNLQDYKRGINEMFRVLRPGGYLAILEFSRPKSPLFAPLYFFYLNNILPIIGGIISGDKEAYRYLATSIQEFPPPEHIASMLDGAGFEEVNITPLTFGVVTLYCCKRPA